MTAEIAILNKSAIALAADSAVTISIGSSQEKIFDSADKLFELSCNDPIAVMVNNNMHFLEIPLPVLIKEYRSKCINFASVAEAAEDFLKHLQNIGVNAPDSVRKRAVQNQIRPLIDWLREITVQEFFDYVSKPSSDQENESLDDIRAKFIDSRIDVLERLLKNPYQADFIDNELPELDDVEKSAILETVQNGYDMASDEQRQRVVDLVILHAANQWLFQPTTGVIFAGFGQQELFPTLLEFEVIGMLGGLLKFSRKEKIDIDRDGERARVVPFAQREMVERFLYGLDGNIERKVTTFCQKTVMNISEHLIAQFDIEGETLENLKAQANDAENAFIRGLRDNGFSAIKTDSQSEIEDMVEFMPKSEMARMAEALVNLTSIKRRVSRGMETVGGPIDVAIISKSEGFVWVKRKHYFPPELNARYFERINGR